MYYQNLQDTYATVIRHDGEIIDTDLQSLEASFQKQSLNSAMYLNMESSDDALSQYLSAYTIGQYLDEILEDTDFIKSVFVYDSDHHTVLCHGNERISNELARGLIQSNEERIWQNAEVNDQNFLLYFYKIHHCWIGCLIAPDDLESIIQSNTADQQTFDRLLIACQDEPISADFNSDDYHQIQKDSNITKSNITYYCTEGKINNELSLIGMKRVGNTDAELSNMQSIDFVIILLLIALAVVEINILWKSLLAPLNEITHGINALKKGDFNTQLRGNYSGEFREIQAALNGAGQEIEQLKIENYEKEISARNLRIETLQKQLRPHFFINCLNNLRTLEMQGDHVKFQEMITALSSYLRYVLNDRTCITLEEECSSVLSYMTIQKIRYTDLVSVDIEKDDELAEVMVPTQILQTLVENSVKYGFINGQKLQIHIRAEMNEDNLFLIEEDNGRGFRKDIMDKLNRREQVKDGDRKCIGLFNLMEKLNMLYGNEFSIQFRNKESGGCYISIAIPFEWEDFS